MKSLLELLNKIFKSSNSELWSLSKVFFLMLIIKILIQLLSFKNLKKVINNLLGNSVFGISPTDIKSVKKIGNTFPNFFSCLPQAITVKLLEGKKSDARIHFGVQNDSKFEAHAWVQRNDTILIGERPTDTFKTIWIW